jgi:nicotinamidase-related amidase
MTGVRDYSMGELKHNVVALAKAAKALHLPIVVTTTARDSMWGPTFPELVEALPGVPIIDRSSVNAFDDPKVAQAITATGRKKLIFAGISLEVCAAFPAITAVGKGLDAYVAVDASGTFSKTKRQVGLLRMLQAGVILSDYATLMVEILRDNARSEASAVYGAIDMPWGQARGADCTSLRQVNGAPRAHALKPRSTWLPKLTHFVHNYLRVIQLSRASSRIPLTFASISPCDTSTRAFEPVLPWRPVPPD